MSTANQSQPITSHTAPLDEALIQLGFERFLPGQREAVEAPPLSGPGIAGREPGFRIHGAGTTEVLPEGRAR